MRLAKRLALGAAGLVVLVLGLLTAVLIRPQLVVNSRTAAWALGRFGKDYAPTWYRLEAGVSSRGLFDKTLALDVDGLCLRGKTPEWSACFRKIRLRVDARFTKAGLERLRLALVDVEAGRIRADLSRPAPPASDTEPAASGPPRLPDWVAALRFGRIALALPDNRIVLATGTLAGSFFAELPDGGERTLSVRARGAREERGVARAVSANAEIRTDAWEGPATRLDVTARADAGALGRARVNARGRPLPGGRLGLNARAAIETTGRRLRLEVSGAGDRRAWSTRLGARFASVEGFVRSAALDGCRLELGLAERKLQPERGSLACRYFVEPRHFGAQAPRRLEGALSARGCVHRDDRIETEAALTIDPTGDWYRLSGRLAARVAGRVGEDAPLRLSHDAELSLDIPRFERLVAYFQDTSFAVPAPLNSLDGAVSIRVTGSGDSRRDPQRFGVWAVTTLADGVQSFRTRLRGSVLARELWTPARRVSADAEWILEDVAFQLPYLELQAPPKVAVDPRIRSGRAKAPAAEGESMRLAPGPKPRALPLELALRVRTPEQPVRLLTNLIKDAVPVRVDLDIRKPGGASLSAHTEPFQIELFRRKAVVERFSISQATSSTSGALDAAFRVATSEATIRILLLGSTAKPRVRFQSDPPMDRNQILALLLFGKPPSQLASEEAASVGHTNAALTEQAFGLASLFVFASTPIEYVGYNPDSQSYVVRLRLPGGATAELGSDLEERRRLVVRKRLARQWAVSTELRRRPDTATSAVTTFLEWFRRY